MNSQGFNESLDLTNAVWDDGEWISWDEINRYVESEAYEVEVDVVEDVEEGPKPEELPKHESSPEAWDQLMNLIRQAQAALEKGENIGNQIGEIGEVFAEAKFGIKRHRRHAQGSDGKIGNNFVEVKTISPWKKKHQVQVKRAGHWNRLLVVRISKPWIFEAKLFARKQLRQGNDGMHLTVSWKPGRQTASMQPDKEKVQPTN
jgi:hypothetical protein